MDFVDPKTFVQNIGIAEGALVADFGSGAGYFTTQLALFVGRGGKVYALDVRRDLLEVLGGYLRRNGIFQVKTMCCDLEKEQGSGLESSSLDFILCANLLHQVDNQESIIKEASRILRSGGKMVVLDWKKKSFLFSGEMFGESEVRKISKKHDFEKYSIIEAGDSHYGLMCVRA